MVPLYSSASTHICLFEDVNYIEIIGRSRTCHEELELIHHNDHHKEAVQMASLQSLLKEARTPEKFGGGSLRATRKLCCLGMCNIF